MAAWLRNTKERSLDGVVVPEIITLTSLEDVLDGLADIFVNAGGIYLHMCGCNHFYLMRILHF